MTPAQELTMRLEALASELGASLDYTERVRLAREIELLIPDFMQAVVSEARADGGLSWAGVGSALGIHRSTAQQRFTK